MSEPPGLPDFRKKVLEDLDLSVQSVQKRASELEGVIKGSDPAGAGSGDARRLVRELWMLADAISAEKDKWLNVLRMDYEQSGKLADERARQAEASVRRLETYASALEKELHDLKVERVALDVSLQESRQEALRLKNEHARVLEFSKDLVADESRRLEAVRREAAEQYDKERESLKGAIEELRRAAWAQSSAFEEALAKARADWAERERGAREEWLKGLQAASALKDAKLAELRDEYELLRQRDDAARLKAAEEAEAKLDVLRDELHAERIRKTPDEQRFAREKAALEAEWRLRLDEQKDETSRVRAAAAVLRAERDKHDAELRALKQGLERSRTEIEGLKAELAERDRRLRERGL